MKVLKEILLVVLLDPVSDSLCLPAHLHLVPLLLIDVRPHLGGGQVREDGKLEGVLPLVILASPLSESQMGWWC